MDNILRKLLHGLLNRVSHILPFCIPVVFTLGVLLGSTTVAEASYLVVQPSIVLPENHFGDIDKIASCTRILRSYLTSQNSVLSDYAHILAKEAFIHHLDCRLVASMAGQESAFGKYYAVPYNGWGWGGGWDKRYAFQSWEHGIQVVSEALDTLYCQNWHACNDPYKIGPIYAEDPHWPDGVTRHMEEMKKHAYGMGITVPF